MKGIKSTENGDCVTNLYSFLFFFFVQCWVGSWIGLFSEALHYYSIRGLWRAECPCSISFRSACDHWRVVFVKDVRVDLACPVKKKDLVRLTFGRGQSKVAVLSSLYAMIYYSFPFLSVCPSVCMCVYATYISASIDDDNKLARA
jgi:hypothetical protein